MRDLEKPVVIREAGSLGDTAQTPGMARRPGVSFDSAGATKVWLGFVTAAPNHWGPPHHHGEAETASYVISGRTRVYFGVDFAEYVEVGPGEFLFVPAEIVHLEANPYDEPCVAVVARSPDNIVVPVDVAVPPLAGRSTRPTSNPRKVSV
jgi:uncharacterized RmlC-like cupin family protein